MTAQLTINRKGKASLAPAKIALAALIFTFQMAFAKELSKECINEFTSLPDKRSNFALDNFLKELPIEVLNTKARMKLPFGKPKPDKITDIGISIGCLNAFPENSKDLTNMVQSIGAEIAEKMMNDLNEKAVRGLKDLTRNGSKANASGSTEQGSAVQPGGNQVSCVIAGTCSQKSLSTCLELVNAGMAQIVPNCDTK